ncbi:unnamed protein product [Protopolystoma xenopodis]|uniref:Uncharacterized protein n=1 Tax=Protopolystoma xenopodis TaxID=117903 RepID=A0A448XN04_9PLAT|nr:unnamed protein product [Protopolystoma xenopodis]
MTLQSSATTVSLSEPKSESSRSDLIQMVATPTGQDATPGVTIIEAPTQTANAALRPICPCQCANLMAANSSTMLKEASVARIATSPALLGAEPLPPDRQQQGKPTRSGYISEGEGCVATRGSGRTHPVRAGVGSSRRSLNAYLDGEYPSLIVAETKQGQPLCQFLSSYTGWLYSALCEIYHNESKECPGRQKSPRIYIYFYGNGIF